MNRIRIARIAASALAVVALAWAAEPAGIVLKAGGRLCVAGDSITEQKLYSRFIETYLTVCLPELNVRVVQLGWGGERAPGFAGRMENDLAGFKPDVVTTCYGMNDGGYRPYDAAAVGKPYEDAMRDIVTRLTKGGATVVVGAPGAVDLSYYRGGGEAARTYNENLGQLREIARKLAAEANLPFADVHGAMVVAMDKARAALGNEYDVCGRDGVHPGPNGQLLMAYAFLKAMGCSGDLGTITMDAKGQATAGGGHKVVSSTADTVELESSRYPFCFFGDEKAPGGTRSILPFVPFNEDLNRLGLVVRNLPWERARVTWGTTSKSFSRADLEKGVNLAAEFLVNPFCEPFQKVDGAVSAKQAFETVMIKSFVTNIPRVVQAYGPDEGVKESLEGLRARMWVRQAQLAEAVRAAFAPVKHSIVVAEDKP